jgi:Arylsulfotransferase (ASST).
LIWYYDYDRSLGIAQPIKLLPNGHFLVDLYVGTTVAGGTLREIDLTGKTVNQLTVTELNQFLGAAGYTWTANSIHHDFAVLPNGHLLVLVNSIKNYDNVQGFPGTSKVLGDSIIDLDPDFNPVWVWSTFDHLDVNRHPMLFPDWTHSNALVYSPDDGNILLSIRHQHWVIKIDYADGQGTGDILWKLGKDGDFTLLNSTSPADWFYAQHFANVISPNSAGDFQLALYDNGDNRILDGSGTICGLNGAPDCYSRPAIFEVNESAKTAQILWEYPTAYSFWGGAIQQLPNTNMFVDVNTPNDNLGGARILELTQDPNPQTVWHLEINGQNSYRTIHLPSLYPGVQW